MQRTKRLSTRVAVAVAMAMLVGASAFADSRHHPGTRGFSGRSFGRPAAPSFGHPASRAWSGRSGASMRSPRFESRSVSPRRFAQPATTWRSDSFRSRGFVDHGRGFVDHRRGFVDAGRSFVNGSRSFADHRFRLRDERLFRDGRRFFGEGRITRIVPFRDGHRVFIDGWRFPFFVPFHRFRLSRFRVGLFIRFGAFYNPFGFYSVYNVGWPSYPYSYPAYYVSRPYYDDRPAYTAGEVHGIVESVDFRRGTIVIDDDISRRFVTVTMPRDRSVDDIRAGDYVEFSGDWTSRGVFLAYRLERFEQRR